MDVPFVWFQYRSLGGYGVVPKKIWPNILTTGTCLLACELQTGRAFVRNKLLFILWTWIHYPLGGLWFQLLVGLVICSSGKSTERYHLWRKLSISVWWAPSWAHTSWTCELKMKHCNRTMDLPYLLWVCTVCCWKWKDAACKEITLNWMHISV